MKISNITNNRKDDLNNPEGRDTQVGVTINDTRTENALNNLQDRDTQVAVTVNDAPQESMIAINRNHREIDLDEEIAEDAPLLNNHPNVPLPQPQPPVILDANQFESEFKILSRVDKLVLLKDLMLTYVTVPLFINAMRLFPANYRLVLASLNDEIYYVCTMDAEVRKAIALDSATILSEAFAITTPLVVIAVPTIALSITYQFARFIQSQSAMNRLINILKAQDRIQATNFRKLYRGKCIAPVRFLAMNPTEIHNICNYLTTANPTLAQFQNAQVKLNPVDAYAKSIQWFYYESGRWARPICIIAAVPGFALMYMASRPLAQKLGCNLWTLVDDNCGVTGQFDMMAFEAWLWMSVSFTYLGYNALAMLILIALTLPLYPTLNRQRENLRESFYTHLYYPLLEKLHMREEDIDWWIFAELAWDIVFTTALPLILAYSLPRAVHTASGYGHALGLPDFWDSMNYIFFDVKKPGQEYPAAQISLENAGFVGDLEVGKIYPDLSIAELVAYALGHRIIPAIWRGLNVSARYTISVDTAKKIHTQFKWAHNWAMTMVGLTIVGPGCYLFFRGMAFANVIIRQPLTANWVVNTVDYQNSSMPTNQTSTEYFQQFCPFGANELDRFNVNNAGDSNRFPFSVMTVNNQTIVSYEFAEMCDIGIIPVFFRNFFSEEIACKPSKWVRGVASFIGSFWTGITASEGGATYLPVYYGLLIFCLFAACKNYYNRPQHNNLDDLDDDPDYELDSEVRQRLVDRAETTATSDNDTDSDSDDDEGLMPQQNRNGCVRSCLRFFKSAPDPRENSRNGIPFYKREELAEQKIQMAISPSRQ